jgi:hypothetical protein
MNIRHRIAATLSNVTKVDTRDSSWQQDLAALVRPYGYYVIGDGKYGVTLHDGRKDYVIKVFKNQANRHVPKIKGKIFNINGMFYAIRVELLSPSPNKWNPKQQEQWDAISLQTDYDKIPSHNLVQIVDFLEDNQNLLDLHLGNVMVRQRTGDIVIIDPFYNWYKGGHYTLDPDNVNDLLRQLQ